MLSLFFFVENEAEATFGMMRAFREWEERSCLKFKRRDNEEDYVNFFKDGGYVSKTLLYYYYYFGILCQFEEFHRVGQKNNYSFLTNLSFIKYKTLFIFIAY